jgi:hypothetical protein
LRKRRTTIREISAVAQPTNLYVVRRSIPFKNRPEAKSFNLSSILDASSQKKSAFLSSISFTTMLSGWSDDNNSNDSDDWQYFDCDDLPATESLPISRSQTNSCQITLGKLQQRRLYGTGIDAMRTAKIRDYDTSKSCILQLLEQQRFIIAKVGLLKLINNALLSCPVNERPNGPSRSQKRLKAGLVQWLDMNSMFMEQYIMNNLATE